MVWTILRTLATPALLVTGATLAGTFIPYIAAYLAGIFYNPEPPSEEIDVRSDVAQLLLGLMFLFQLEFIEFLVFNTFLDRLHNFEVQTVIIEVLHVINYIRGCYLLTFVTTAVRTGAILEPMRSPFDWSTNSPPVPGYFGYSWKGKRERFESMADNSVSIGKTIFGCFIISFSYVITHYFALEFSEERAIFRLFQAQERENILNNNHRHRQNVQ